MVYLKPYMLIVPASLVVLNAEISLRRQERPNLRHKNRSPEELEKLVISYSLENPHLGQAQVSRQLNKHYATEISPDGVRSIWLREEMNTAALRARSYSNSQNRCD
jgi:hypothetical protein